MLMNRICIAFNGLLKPKNVLRVIKVSAATAVLSWKERKFWILWKIDLPMEQCQDKSRIKPLCLPSSTAGRIVLKLSSTRIMSAASFATSVPLLPIDTPISAIFRAGASLTEKD